MEFLGPGEPGGTLLTFLLNMIIVQNTSAPAYPSLDAVPLVPLSSVTSASSTSLSSTASGQPTSLLPPAVPAPKKDGHHIAAIVAPVVALLVVVGLIFVLWRRLRAKLHVAGQFAEQGNDSHLMPTPFPNEMSGGQRRQENRRLSLPIFHQDGSEIGDMPPSYHASSYEAADIFRDPPRTGALSNPNRQGPMMAEREKGVVLRGPVAQSTYQEHRTLGRTAGKG
ncbi:hypothetical protein D9613_007338 [Agrocybe pediades]|uniref:Uncharacterized protein n=1 Tax=Agrocybe pediades TaxID=84607 RepID=A0A8H4QGF1_9AGAR|nr:hypothetical protein D9613_007338 [Agrocybe pediades]